MKTKFEYIARRYFNIGSAINSGNKEELKHVVKHESELTVVGCPEHGTHKLDVVKDTVTGNEYVRKQTKSHTETEKEFMMANFLNSANPNHPECLLGENENGSVSILSHKRENTKNVEQFVREGRTPELLTKPVVGLADTLIADNILGKQSDTKLANMLVTEKEDGSLVFSNIDHERANLPKFSFFNSGMIRFPTTSDELINGIHDLHDPSDENRSGLAGDPRAKEFGSVARQVITQEEIQSSYKKIASADTEALHTKCTALSQYSIFFGGRNNCNAYQQHFKEIQKKASEISDFKV